MTPFSRSWILLAAAIAAFGALIHLAAIPAGPSWYAWFGAPVGAIVIAALMATCAWYACAALDLVRRLY
jgi:hypothetical protein